MTMTDLITSHGHGAPGASSSRSPVRPLLSSAEAVRVAGGGVSADLPSPVSFTMPVPPSVNQAFKNVRGRGRAKTKAYEDWLLYAYQCIRLQKVPPVPGHIIVRIGFERESLLSDVDNRIKLALDAIVSAGVIEDDRLITALAVSWLPPANGLAHIEISPIQSQVLEFHPSSNGATGAWIRCAPQPEEPF